MSNSSLVRYTRISPNQYGKRNHAIDRITPHCVVGQCSIETLGNIFAPKSRGASCNYGIGADGRVGMYVEENCASWCSSNKANDERAVTIECASATVPPYTMNSSVYATLVNLCVDICKRNGKNKLIWFGDKTKTLNYAPKSNEMVLTVHRWFANKACPGDWLYGRLGTLASEVTKRLGGGSTPAPAPTPAPKHAPAPAKKSNDTIANEVIAGKWGNNPQRAQKLKAAGYDPNAIQALVNQKLGAKSKPAAKPSAPAKKSIDTIAREVIAGKWGNGATRKQKLTAAGYNYSEVQKRVNQLLK